VGCAFEVASVTKMVTAVIIMQLVNEGQLALDGAWSEVDGGSVSQLICENVRTWPGERFGAATLRQLLQHTSGLPNYWDDDCRFVQLFEEDENHQWTTWELLGFAAQMPLSCAPGERGSAQSHRYADTNYLILGLVIEAVTCSPLATAFRLRVFEPAGMSASGTYCSFLELRPGAAPPLSRRYVYQLEITGKPQHAADSFAAGGIVSTSEDLGCFLRALSGGLLFPIGGLATLEKMKSWIPTPVQGMSYGLGLMRIDLADTAGCLSGRARRKLEGHLWGHMGFGGAFAWQWDSPGHPGDGAIITGTTNNEARCNEIMVVEVMKALGSA
ncbi:unnamed protein product, partial [Polarella glacialis]